MLETEKAAKKTVRFRTIGDITCTGAVESTASNLDEVNAEVVAAQKPWYRRELGIGSSGEGVGFHKNAHDQGRRGQTPTLRLLPVAEKCRGEGLSPTGAVLHLLKIPAFGKRLLL